MENNYDKEKSIEEMSENEIDERLHFDALMGGVKAGGLRSVSSIHLMVCYIVANLSGKVTAEVITDAMAQGELANYFEVTSAIGRLLQNGTIQENEDGTLVLGNSDTDAVDLIEQDLPYTVRVRGIALCQRILAKEKNKKENKTEIIKNENSYTVILHISGGDTEFMKLSLFAPTITEAELIRDKFLNNPSAVYEKLIDAIFENEEE